METPVCESVGWEASASYRRRLLPIILTMQVSTNRNADVPHTRRRYVMKKFMVAIALFAIIAIPTLSTSVNAATVSPSSSEFGSNGY